MKSNQIRLIVISMGMFLLFSLSNGMQAQTTGWNITPAIKATKNPVPTSKESIADGKELYSKHCKSCHGSAGLGDGTRASTLDVACGDFSSSKFQASTDGEIFFQISTGKGKMPSFKRLVPEDNGRWAIVNYIRTLAAK